MMHHFAPPRTSPRDDWIVDPKRGRNPTRPSHPCVTESIFVLYEVAERDAGSRRSRKSPVLRQNLGRRQVVDLSALIRRESRLDDHPLAPPASTPPVPLRRPPPARCREPCPAAAAGRVQTTDGPTQAAPDGSPLLDLAGESLGRLDVGLPSF